jgi:uncharacterized membrane protein YbhN (UPF0104 family)
LAQSAVFQALVHWGRALAGNKWLMLTLGVVVSVALAYAALNRLAWREVIDTFQHFPYAYAALSVVPIGLAMILRAGRWWVLMRGERVSFWQVFITQNAGIGLNNMLPIRVGSEAMQLTLVTRRYGVPLPVALASLVGGNVLDIFATGILMGLGVLLVPGLRETSVSIQLFGAIVMLTVSMLVVVGVSKGLGSIPGANRLNFFHRVINAINDLRDKPRALVASFVATLAHWFLMGVAGWVLALGFDLNVDPLTMATVLVAGTFFTSAMLSAPGGGGTYHFAVMSMLTALGSNAERAFGFTLVMHLLVFAPPLLMALGVMLRFGSEALLRKEQPLPADSGLAS